MKSFETPMTRMIIWLGAASLLACSPASSEAPQMTETAPIDASLDTDMMETREHSGEVLLAPEATEDVLDAMDEGSVWTRKDLQAIIAEIKSLDAHGLNPDHYHLAELEAVTRPNETSDRLATDAWLSAASHMIYGKLNPETVEPDWTAARRQVDLPAMLSQLQETKDLSGSLTALAPKQKEYAVLKDTYAALRAEAETPITQVPAGDAIKAKMGGPRVTALQTRLKELGYLTVEQITGTMDDTAIDALKLFQAANDLDDDGVAGAATIAALNRGLTDRLNALRINMERWRWLPDDLGPRYLRANIAGFTVTAFENGQPVRTHLTIVGKPYRKTPVFSDEVEYIVFNPWWETPPSLAVKDKLPTFKKDPSQVQKLGFEVLDRSGQRVDASTINWNDYSAGNFPFRIRQKPGDANALGQVKIMFPNKHNVYLHDTPTRGLFAQRQRAFSSGCLRTQDPIDLSEWLLKDTPGWDRAKIDAAVNSKRETRATLAAKVPVHILYQTAIAEAGGTVRFLDDIYSRDAAVLAGLMKAPG